jgi:hypothetical protein
VIESVERIVEERFDVIEIDLAPGNEGAYLVPKLLIDDLASTPAVLVG